MVPRVQNPSPLNLAPRLNEAWQQVTSHLLGQALGGGGVVVVLPPRVSLEPGPSWNFPGTFMLHC